MTQVRMKEDVKKDLELLKENEHEPLGDVVNRLIGNWNNVEKYSSEFKDFVKYVLEQHFPDNPLLHVTECSAGLQVYFEMSENNNIMILHNELKMWEYMCKEGLEPSEKSYALLDMAVLQSIDHTVR